jgi:UDP-N-acetylglucosamine 2-epimerase (non-hydrolysing)
MDPVGYLDFLKLLNNARLCLTDSGGIQEEACILNVPCVTLRENTERPEAVSVGANILAGTNPVSIVDTAGIMLERTPSWKNPFGDGQAAVRIIDVIEEVLDS